MFCHTARLRNSPPRLKLVLSDRTREEETVPYPEGDIVNFSSDVTSFFDQYLEDMADISNLDDSARLNFPVMAESNHNV